MDVKFRTERIRCGSRRLDSEAALLSQQALIRAIGLVKSPACREGQLHVRDEDSAAPVIGAIDLRGGRSSMIPA